MWLKLDYLDGDFFILLKSDIPAIKHKRIRAYHMEMLSKLAGCPVWEPREFARDLYDSFSLYYKKVCELLDVDCDRLLDESRHLFLICTKPVDNRPGLSGLEQLMGYSLQAEQSSTDTESKKDFPTTGDEVLDIQTDLFLIFKQRAAKIWESRSLEECALMCKQANERMKSPDDEEPTTWTEDPPPKEDETFSQFKQQIVSSLTSMGIILPEEF